MTNIEQIFYTPLKNITLNFAVWLLSTAVTKLSKTEKEWNFLNGKISFVHIQSFIQNEKENDSFILICWPTVLKN